MEGLPLCRPPSSCYTAQVIEAATGVVPPRQSTNRAQAVTMEKELLFITVIGQDKKGIVARISNLLYECNVNIEDISQGIMEGYFIMTMAVDMREANRDLEAIGSALQALGKDMGMTIQIQHQNVFKMMHRI
jgi:ACT domain-containing protein